MKRYSLGFLALLLSVAVVSAPAVFATAGADVVREIVPFQFDDVNPCSGEAVTLSGELRITTRITEDANGGFHFAYNLVPSGITGTGASGATYRAVGGEREAFNVAFDGAPLTDTYTSMFNLVSQGGTDNFIASITLHVTVNANGVVTVIVESGGATCRG